MAKSNGKNHYERAASKKEMAMIEEQQKHILDVVVERMESDGLEWTKGFKTCFCSPYNPYTGTVYKGRNAFSLSLIATANGWDDPRWVTPKRLIAEAKKAKEERGEEWSFKGQKTSLVIKYKSFAVYEKDDNGEYTRDENGQRKIIGSYMRPMPPIRVINMAQVAGAPKWEAPEAKTLTAAEADRLIETCVCSVRESAVHKTPCYVPRTDEIRIPARGQYGSVEGFTSTLAHEYTHATGATNRLNRKLTGNFGSDNYAFEELVAELGSVLVCSQLGFSYEGPGDIDAHAAYLKSWIRGLKEDDGHSVLQKAFSEAQRACEMIMSRYDAEESAEVGEAEEASAA